MYQTSFIPQGWECPKCKRVYSPTTSMCAHCPQHTQGITSSGTTSTANFHNFESDKKISLKTKCKICGKEAWEHPTITLT